MGNFQSPPTNVENHETKNCTHKPIRDVFCRLCHLAVKTVLRHKQHNQMNSGHWSLPPKSQTADKYWPSSLPCKLNLTSLLWKQTNYSHELIDKGELYTSNVATQSQAILESLPTWSASTFRLEYLDPLGHNIQILTCWRKCNFSTAYGTNLYRNRQ